MSEATPLLALPLLAAAQAQKHVTHNEALVALDALVQLAVLDKDRTAPPPDPAEGDRYLIAAPAPTGAWAGWAGRVVRYQDGAWRSFVPRPGWLAFVADEADLYTYTGAAWASFRSTLTALQNLVRLGIGTTADATNPFAAKLNTALWTASSAAEGGTGDLRYTLNKEAARNTLSLLFQSGFSGRAEIGLTGDDDLRLKVSADGGTWREALRVDRATGGLALAGRPAWSGLTPWDSGNFNPASKSNAATIAGSVADFDAIWSLGSGAYMLDTGGINNPNGPGHLNNRVLQVGHGGRGLQICNGYGDLGSLYFRGAEDAAYSSWRRVWSDGDFTIGHYAALSGAAFTGSVGIGTSSPQALLDVAGAARFGGAVVCKSATGDASLDLDAATARLPVLRWLVAGSEKARVQYRTGDATPSLAFSSAAAGVLLSLRDDGAVAIGNNHVSVSTAGITLGRRLELASYTVGTVPGGIAGGLIFVSNARKINEGAGSGTGVLASYSNGNWRRLSDDSPVAA